MPQLSQSHPSLEFLIGRDGHGQWLVVETHGLAGGFFASAKAAFRFVHSDYHERAKRIEVVGDILEPFGRTCVEIAENAAAAPSASPSAAAA